MALGRWSRLGGLHDGMDVGEGGAGGGAEVSNLRSRKADCGVGGEETMS